MKRLLALILSMLFLVGCAAEPNTTDKETELPNSSDDVQIVTAPTPKEPDGDAAPIPTQAEEKRFPLPAEVTEIDLSLYDPSNDDIIFRIDEDGYVVSYIYYYEGVEYSVAMFYDGRTVGAYTFEEDELLGVQTFTAQSDFDPTIGMIEHEGYYFRGYDMGE